MRHILGVTICLLAMSGTGVAQCSDAEKKALMAFDAAWGKATVEGDKAALMAIYADDYVGFPGMQAKGSAIDDTMAAFQRNKANPAGADKVAYDHRMVSCTPVTATITHRNTITTPKGETFFTRSIHFLEKRGGKWQVVSNAGHALNDAGIIWYLEQDWNDAILKRDKAWFEKNYATDFSGVDTMTGRLSNKAEDIAGIVNDKGAMELAETADISIRIDGDRAIVTGIFRTKGKDEKGVAYDRRARFTDTWIKRDGRWQAWASQGTIIPAADMTAKNQ